MVEYPRWKYHWAKEPRIVQSPEDEAALGGGWADTPAAFERYRDAARAKPKQPDPLRLGEQWKVAGLLPGHQNQIKAQLLKAHALFWRSPDTREATANSMRLAFDGIAGALFGGGILTPERLEKDIPALVWDSAVAGGWWYLASQTCSDIFPEQIGHHWVWRDEAGPWRCLFRAETATWSAKLLERESALPPNAAHRQADLGDGAKTSCHRERCRAVTLSEQLLGKLRPCANLETLEAQPLILGH